MMKKEKIMVEEIVRLLYLLITLLILLLIIKTYYHLNFDTINNIMLFSNYINNAFVYNAYIVAKLQQNLLRHQ